MTTSISELRYKEVINVNNGIRYGYVSDLEVDLGSGQVKALLIPGRRKWLGLLGREADHRIPWPAVRRFGDDIILVDGTAEFLLSE